VKGGGGHHPHDGRTFILTITYVVPPLISQEGISYTAQPRPNWSESKNGPGEGLSRLREIAPEVADASKAPSPKLGSVGHMSPCGVMDTCHPNIRRAHK
jgi:hypothetical protein